MRELFCLNGAGKRHPGCKGRFQPLRASGWAVHAYYRRTGPFSAPPGRDDITPSTVGKLRSLLAKAQRRHRVTGRLGLWDTEDGVQTRPPDPKGATLTKQATFINEAEYLAWRTPYMRSFSQYLFADEDPVWAFQSGLVTSNGKPKPALSSYRLPIYVAKAGKGVVVWGHVPTKGVVTIHPSKGADVALEADGYFTKRLSSRASSYELHFGDWVSRRASPR
jgi:hypothetical protein